MRHILYIIYHNGLRSVKSINGWYRTNQVYCPSIDLTDLSSWVVSGLLKFTSPILGSLPHQYLEVYLTKIWEAAALWVLFIYDICRFVPFSVVFGLFSLFLFLFCFLWERETGSRNRNEYVFSILTVFRLLTHVTFMSLVQRSDH